MIIDMKRISESAWVVYDGDFELLIRPLSSSKQEEFSSQATTESIEFVKGRRVTVKKRDEEKYEELLRDWIVEDWRGAVDPDGNAVACDRDVKLQLLDYMHDVRKFALEAALDLHNIKQADREKDSRD